MVQRGGQRRVLDRGVAAAVQSRYSGGVAFVDLSALRDAGLVASSIAQELGIREDSSQDTQMVLGAYLRQRRMLLVLDNFEQLVTAGPLVAALLVHSPQLVVLVTIVKPRWNLQTERSMVFALHTQLPHACYVVSIVALL